MKCDIDALMQSIALMRRANRKAEKVIHHAKNVRKLREINALEDKIREQEELLRIAFRDYEAACNDLNN